MQHEAQTTGRWYMDLDELLNELLKTCRDSRPADSAATVEAKEIRAEILRRFGQ